MWLPRRIENLIETITVFLGEIKDRLKNEDSSKPDAPKTSYVERSEIAGIIGAAIKATNPEIPARIKANEQKDKAQRRLEYRLQRRMLLTARITAVATTLAFAAAFWYACIAKSELQDLRNHFQVDERAWVKVEEIWRRPEMPDDTSVPVKFTNVGKSLIYTGAVEVYEEILDHQTAPILRLDGCHTGGQVGIIFPTDHSTITAHRLGSAPECLVFGLTGPEKSALDSGQSYVVVFGAINYADQFGTHWTRFCNWTPYMKPDSTPTQYGPATQACLGFNRVGEGEIPPQD